MADVLPRTEKLSVFGNTAPPPPQQTAQKPYVSPLEGEGYNKTTIALVVIIIVAIIIIAWLFFKKDKEKKEAAKPVNPNNPMGLPPQLQQQASQQFEQMFGPGVYPPGQPQPPQMQQQPQQQQQRPPQPRPPVQQPPQQVQQQLPQQPPKPVQKPAEQMLQEEEETEVDSQLVNYNISADIKLPVVSDTPGAMTPKDMIDKL